MTGPAEALRLLTRLPLPKGSVAHEPWRSVGWLPVAGALLGLLEGGILVLAGWVLPAPVAALIALGVALMVTGALHEDGLADTFDALGATDPLQAMSDPRLGAFGASALVWALLLRATALHALLSSGPLVPIVLAHGLSRAAVVGMMLVLPPAAPTGSAAAHMEGLRPGGPLVGILVSGAAAGLLVGWWVLPVLAAGSVGPLLVGRWAASRLGGVTGDVLGAAQQLSLLAVLVVLVARGNVA